ncbi:MAG: response regulator transcription factor [Gracilimonas sp.]|uniref:response regulator n=1 Tax=Gracilimonas TaxID=649462 RepID=UPI001B072EEA|nr:response regulator transcription factor [Gracilimonas sp.]MBO6587364.1 response regulator transcription factor [Gracilimonas sp.]MBO6614150.1 response regulator transcription factor [Gracilimonas sp.]
MKIMIVDDHAAMRRLLGNILTLGYKDFSNGKHTLELVECESGEEAIEQFPKTRPDVILMDFQLTKMNGIEAAEAILQQDSSAKILFVTSYNSSSLRDKARHLSTLGFMSKNNLSDIMPMLSSQHHIPDTL